MRSKRERRVIATAIIIVPTLVAEFGFLFPPASEERDDIIGMSLVALIAAVAAAALLLSDRDL